MVRGDEGSVLGISKESKELKKDPWMGREDDVTSRIFRKRTAIRGHHKIYNLYLAE